MISKKVKLSYNVSPKTKEIIKKLANLLDKKEGKTLDEIIEDYIKDKVLSDDYYYIMKPYLFSKKDLKKNGATKGYENDKPPNTNNKDIIVVRYIPTTFDEFNEEFKTYCYDKKPCLHKGVITTKTIQDNKLVLLVITTKLKEKKMNIELYKGLDELYLIEDLRNHGKRKEIEKRLKAQYNYDNGITTTYPKIKDWLIGDYGCLEEYDSTNKLLYGIQKIEDIGNDEN